MGKRGWEAGRGTFAIFVIVEVMHLDYITTSDHGSRSTCAKICDSMPEDPQKTYSVR